MSECLDSHLKTVNAGTGSMLAVMERLPALEGKRIYRETANVTQACWEFKGGKNDDPHQAIVVEGC